MISSYSLPSLYEVVKPELYTATAPILDHGRHGSSAFQRVDSPPELLHDSEEDDGDSLSSLQQHDFFDDDHPRRKSMPHRSPSILQDGVQAAPSAILDKSVIFQWNSTGMQPSDQQSKVICGESLLSALRHRVAMSRQQDLPIKKRIIHMPRRQLTATCITLPTHHKQHITKHKMSIPVLTSSPPSKAPSVLVSSYTPTSPVIPEPTLSLPPPTTPSPTLNAPKPQPTKQRGRKPMQHTTRHASSGRPSRVKGPCQACHETSDGCMRKAFDWPFPASQIFNDKGKPFVYLCNKCGLRYNKSGGSVCRHCRWVFCKEEKRKAMQFIDKMRRNRPDKHVDMDENIEDFVCSPKYWQCGRPWKVGWVLNNNNSTQKQDSEDEDHDSLASL